MSIEARTKSADANQESVVQELDVQRTSREAPSNDGNRLRLNARTRMTGSESGCIRTL